MILSIRFREQFKKMIKDWIYAPYEIRGFFFCLSNGLCSCPVWRFRGLPFIRREGQVSSIQIGEHFVACSYPRHNSLGIFQRVTIWTVGHGAVIDIEDDMFIGAKAIIRKGVTIGSGIVVGAGAIVTRAISAFSICAGNSARAVGHSRNSSRGERE